MNSNNTPQMNGDINEFASATRRAFIKVQNAFNSKYNYEGNNTTAFLKSLECMMNERYCTAVISEQFNAAQEVAAVGRCAIIAMRPFVQDLTDAFIELDRNVNYLEIAIGQEINR